ncbi:MAG: AI-2E family transporter [Anaerolineales bacterium]|jgi:predicted PurR-regulated permease PerM
MSQEKKPDFTSPPWQPATRIVAAVLLLLLVGALAYSLRSLLVPLALAGLLAFVLHPVVNMLATRAKMGRRLAVIVVYSVLILLLLGATTGAGLMITQQLGALVEDVRRLATELPELLEGLTELQITIGPWTWDLSQVNLQPVLEGLGSAIQPLLRQTGALLGSVAGATASTVAMMLAVMVLGYYLLKDFAHFELNFLSMVPHGYRDDVERLLDETGRVWGSFLRGQLVLSLVVGVLVALVMGLMGVRLALVLGLVAGLLEFVPVFGALIAGLIAAIVAFFQGSNWWGLSSFAFVIAVILVFMIIQQIENNVLVPRIIGQSLNLHPIVVLMAALAGGMLAGVIGLLLAAPAVATLRLWMGYVYIKIAGLEAWPAPVLVAPESELRFRSWLRRIRWPKLRRRSPEEKDVAGGE